jgi:hypothetical protein
VSTKSEQNVAGAASPATHTMKGLGRSDDVRCRDTDLPRKSIRQILPDYENWRLTNGSSRA